MAAYKDLTKEELLELKSGLQAQFEEVKARGLKLDMSRGKPAADVYKRQLPDIASKSRILTQQLDMFFQHYSLAVSLEIFIIRNRNRRGEPEI